MIKLRTEVRLSSRSTSTEGLAGFRPGTTHHARGVYSNQGTLPDGTLATIRWKEGEAPTISTGGQTRALTGQEMMALAPIISQAAGEGSNRLGLQLLSLGSADEVRQILELQVQAHQRARETDDFCPAPPTLPRF